MTDSTRWRHDKIGPDGCDIDYEGSHSRGYYDWEKGRIVGGPEIPEDSIPSHSDRSEHPGKKKKRVK